MMKIVKNVVLVVVCSMFLVPLAIDGYNWVKNTEFGKVYIVVVK